MGMRGGGLVVMITKDLGKEEREDLEKEKNRNHDATTSSSLLFQASDFCKAMYSRICVKQN